jgi:hypothetical protein
MAEELKRDQELQAIELKSQQLKAQHEAQKSELYKLESNLSTDYPHHMNYDDNDDDELIEGDSTLYADCDTPGNPDFEEYKYHDDAFHEDIDIISDGDDNQEIAELHQEVEKLK